MRAVADRLIALDNTTNITPTTNPTHARRATELGGQSMHFLSTSASP